MENNSAKVYWRERLVLISLGTALVVNIILWVVLLSKFGFGGGEGIPLHFSVVYGIDLVGPAKKVFLLPLVGFVALLVNAFLGRMLYRENDLLGNFLNFSTVVVQLLIAVPILTILNLVR